MLIIVFVVELMAAVLLLLYAVRMVRTGIERSFDTALRRAITEERSRVGSAGLGLLLAVVLQSSAAVVLLASGFASTGFVSFTTGISLILGADLGSALIIQILSFDLSLIMPVLLATGGWLTLKTERQTLHHAGRILLGVAFILVSLEFLRAAVAPVRESSFLPLFAEYLAADHVTAFIVGTALAFIMHSSVAAILVIVTLVQIGALPFLAGLAVVLGANLGSGLIAVWLTRGMPPAAVRLPIGNLVFRGGMALAVLPWLGAIDSQLSGQGIGQGQGLVLSHILFNAILMIITLPFVGRTEPLLRILAPDNSTDRKDSPLLSAKSALTSDADISAQNAIASLRRELLRMSEQVERMFAPVPSLYRSYNPNLHTELRKIEDEVDTCLETVRKFVAELPIEKYEKSEVKTIRGLMDYAIRLEAAGDVVATSFVRLSETLEADGIQLSKAGLSEINDMHTAIVSNLSLANNVLVSDDMDSARFLVQQKSVVKRAERRSRKKHLNRLSLGKVQSHESSNVHLETIRSLRDFNSDISAIAYPTLHREGQILDTRLVFDNPKNARSKF